MNGKAIKSVLLVEDNRGDARLLREMLNEEGSTGAALTHVECMSEAEAYLTWHEADIILLDLGLSDAQGMEAVRRAHAVAPGVPLVVLTGLDDESVALKALQGGAQDYLVKGQISTRGLLRSLRYAVERKVLEEALMAEAEHLRMSETRLRESRRHLTRAQELAESGSFEHDLETGTRTWSDNLYNIFGIFGADKDNFPTNRISEFVHPADAARYDSFYRVHASGTESETEDPANDFRIIRRDGNCRTLIIECALCLGETGRADVLLGTVRDVTSAKANEERLRGLETQLQHSQRLEALGTLAGGIAHDLNNALMPTIILTDMVMETHPEGSSGRASLGLALAGARRAKELVRQILAFARKGTAAKHPFDLAALVHEAMGLLRASLPATIELVILEEPIPAMFGDHGQLHQVIMNLVTNAAQAIGSKSGRITVALRPASDESRVELTIADTGDGMDEATKHRMFDPFFTTRAVNEGTGLGLSIVHGIVVAHDGTIAVTSQLGCGSKFSISLPVAGDRQDGNGGFPMDPSETLGDPGADTGPAGDRRGAEPPTIIFD